MYILYIICGLQVFVSVKDVYSTPILNDTTNFNFEKRVIGGKVDQLGSFAFQDIPLPLANVLIGQLCSWLGQRGRATSLAKCKMASYKVEVVTKPVGLGEGPHWDVATQTLYFIDIRGGSVHSYKPSTNEYHTAVIGDGKLPVSLIVPVEGEKNKFVITIKNQFAVITWDGKSPNTSTPEVIATAEPQDNDNRINDGKCDAKGRLWAGSMGKPGGADLKTWLPVGSFYSLENKTVKKHLGNIKCSNGLTWSLDNKKLYYIDSFKHTVDSYDYDITSGTIENQKIVFDFKANGIPGIPDGMTIDTEGKLFVANFDGSQVLRIDPETGKVISKIIVPALQTTSVAFGGKNLDELYVTSANLDPTTDLPAAPNGTNGCVFKVTKLGVKGLPMTNIKL